jgi:hypothetical protein
MQHIRCHLQFSTTKMMQHMHPRCRLFRDKLAKGEDNEEWTPRRLMGITGILGSLFLQHHWCIMLLPRKIISADKDEKSTNEEEQSKKGSKLTTTKPPTDEIAPLLDPDRENIMQDPGPVNLDAMIATVDLPGKRWNVLAGPVNLEAMIASISLPGNKWDVLDVPPCVRFADGHNAKVAADIFSVGPWRYYFCEKYNAEQEIEPVHCPVRWDLVKYLA